MKQMKEKYRFECPKCGLKIYIKTLIEAEAENFHASQNTRVERNK